MQSYQIICEKYPLFSERLKNVDLVVEISLQPWKVFKPDGVKHICGIQFYISHCLSLRVWFILFAVIFLFCMAYLQVILFSDILTPLSGMNIPFDIVKGKGPVIFDPLHTAADVDQVREFVPEESVPYVGEALTILRKEVLLSMFSF